MAYEGLTIETTTRSPVARSSHCIPAYPEYTSKTSFDTAYYSARQESNDDLAGGEIELTSD